MYRVSEQRIDVTKLNYRNDIAPFSSLSVYVNKSFYLLKICLVVDLRIPRIVGCATTGSNTRTSAQIKPLSFQWEKS